MLTSKFYSKKTLLRLINIFNKEISEVNNHNKSSTYNTLSSHIGSLQYPMMMVQKTSFSRIVLSPSVNNYTTSCHKPQRTSTVIQWYSYRISQLSDPSFLPFYQHLQRFLFSQGFQTVTSISVNRKALNG